MEQPPVTERSPSFVAGGDGTSVRVAERAGAVDCDGRREAAYMFKTLRDTWRAKHRRQQIAQIQRSLVELGYTRADLKEMIDLQSQIEGYLVEGEQWTPPAGDQSPSVREVLATWPG
jgi:hypothetical protein